MESPAVDVKPLTCPSCDGPVPLADADQVKCPYCGAEVLISERLRSLKRELGRLDEEKKAADRLYRRLGKPPPRFLRVFSFFDSAWFWMLGLGFWITAGLVVFIASVPWVGQHLFHVNTWDVLTERQQSMISIGGTMSTVAIGLLLSGWSRKRTVSRGSLQAALAAAPPKSAGGPAQCRLCGAALAVAPGALGARCDYCGADNLVQIPAEWVAKVRSITRAVTHQQRTLFVEEAKARSSLRWSLFWRLVIGTLLVAPFLIAIGAVDDSSSIDVSEVKLYGEASFLPKWTRDQIPTWTCTDDGPWYQASMIHCSDDGVCESAELVALRAGKPFEVRVQLENLEVAIDSRQMGIYSAGWVPVARAPLTQGHATLIPPTTGWYRVRLIGARPTGRVNFCRSQPGA